MVVIDAPRISLLTMFSYSNHYYFPSGLTFQFNANDLFVSSDGEARGIDPPASDINPSNPKAIKSMQTGYSESKSCYQDKVSMKSRSSRKHGQNHEQDLLPPLMATKRPKACTRKVELLPTNVQTCIACRRANAHIPTANRQ